MARHHHGADAIEVYRCVKCGVWFLVTGSHQASRTIITKVTRRAESSAGYPARTVKQRLRCSGGQCPGRPPRPYDISSPRLPIVEFVRVKLRRNQATLQATLKLGGEVALATLLKAHRAVWETDPTW